MLSLRVEEKQIRYKLLLVVYHLVNYFNDTIFIFYEKLQKRT